MMGSRQQDGLGYWSLPEMQQNCRVLSHLFGGDQPVETFSCFVFVPYLQYRTSGTAAKAYAEAHPDTVGFFLARIDFTDCRHVLVGFAADADRSDFLATPEIITKRPDESDP